MATEKVPADTAAPAKADTQAGSFDLTLDEFCLRLSGRITAPELIGGFHHAQKLAGKLKDSEAAFTAAFDAFRKQPA